MRIGKHFFEVGGVFFEANAFGQIGKFIDVTAG